MWYITLTAANVGMKAKNVEWSWNGIESVAAFVLVASLKVNDICIIKSIAITNINIKHKSVDDILMVKIFSFAELRSREN